MNTPKPNPIFEPWSFCREHIKSSVGVWRGGKDTWFQNLSMRKDVIGDKSYMQILTLNATGKLPNRDFADWLETNFIGLSYPDSRIWCNQVAAFAGCLSTTPTSAIAAAILAADSRAYGGNQTSESGMMQLQKARKLYLQSQSWKNVCSNVKQRNGKPMFIGFARPVDKDDERITPYDQHRQKLGLPEGKYLKFALELSNHLNQAFGLAINSGGYANAMLLDNGFSGLEAARIKAFAVAGGAIASYRDNLNKTSTFLPQHCSDIEYIGIEPRNIPKE